MTFVLPDEGSCYTYSTRNDCCEFLASYGVNLSSDHFSKASLWYFVLHFTLMFGKSEAKKKLISTKAALKIY